MKVYELQQSKQLELLVGICMEKTIKGVPAKRVSIVQVKLIREKTMLYKDRKIRSPRDAYELIRDFLGGLDREHFVARDPITGKKKQKTVSDFNRKEEAQLAATAIQQELAQGTYIREKDILFKDFVIDWLKEYQTSVKISIVRVREHESSKLKEYIQGFQVKQNYQKDVTGFPY
jgi:hypothetical protein